MVGSCTRIMAKKKLLLSFEDEEDTKSSKFDKSVSFNYNFNVISQLYAVTW